MISDNYYLSIDPTATVPAFPLIQEIDTILSLPFSGEKISFDINAVTKSTSDNPKPGKAVNSSFKKGGRRGDCWLTLSANVEHLFEFIRKSFCLRLGVKNAGTDYRHHFVSTDFIYLDVDSGHTTTETLNLFTGIACCVYGTPSYTEENQKHRIVVRLSKTLYDWRQVTALIQYFINHYPFLDRSCTDPSRIMFGSFDQVFFTDSETVLDIEGILADSEFQRLYDDLLDPEDRVSSQKQVTIEDKHHFPFVSALEKRYNWDLNLLFAALGVSFEFNFKEISPDGDAVRKWEGKNPWSKENKSGRSLVVSLVSGKLLVFDRSNGPGHGGTIFGLLYCLQQDYSSLSDDVFDLSTFTSFRTSLIDVLYPEGSPSVAKKTIYTVNPKNGEKKLKDILTIFDEDIYPALRGIFYVLESEAEKLTYYYYVGNKWKITQNVNFVKKYLFSVIKRVYSEEHVPSSLIEKVTTNVLLVIPEYLEIERPPSPDLNYVFFSNGAYNLTTKVLETDKPDHWCFRRLDYPYLPSTGEGMKLLIKAFKQSGVVNEDRVISTKALILSLYNQFFKTESFLYFYGPSTTGKSVFARIFAATQCHGISNAVNVLSNPEHFGTYVKSVTVIDEITNFARIEGIISTLVRDYDDRGNTFRYRNLFIAGREEVLPLTMILTSEVLSLGNPNYQQINGIGNRCLTVQFNNKLHRKGNYWKNIYSNKENYRDIARNIVEMSVKPEKIINWFYELFDKKESVQGQRTQEMLATADPLYDFIDYFEVDPKWNGESIKGGYTSCYTSQEIIQMYKVLTGDDTRIKHSSDAARFMQRFNNLIREKYPLYKRVKIKPNDGGSTWRFFGIILKNSQNNQNTLVEFGNRTEIANNN